MKLLANLWLDQGNVIEKPIVWVALWSKGAFFHDAINVIVTQAMHDPFS
jgi:hypothetical protein